MDGDVVPGAAIELHGHEMVHRTFLLGNEGGFVFYQPVEQNKRDVTAVSSKWFGASEFGRTYLQLVETWIILGQHTVRLDRGVQAGFAQYLDRAVRAFQVEGVTIRQTWFVPDSYRAVVMTLEADQPACFAAEPEFDMRYYQAMNTTFTNYSAEVVQGRLEVFNRIPPPNASTGTLSFYASVQPVGEAHISLLPEAQRLRHKTYLTDEFRKQRIQASYSETAATATTSPDEAPLWQEYHGMVYAPARLEGRDKLTLVFAFDDGGQAAETAQIVAEQLTQLEQKKRSGVRGRLAEGAFASGSERVDQAYDQVFTRFNQCLVARDVTVGTSTHTIEHFYAIFAGDRYFLDAWKRDENISLGALLQTNDFATVRAILRETWQFQDQRTGRLPHIIRLGEPLVYYSSDGTLWALFRLWQYTIMSGDASLLEEKYPMVEHFFRASLNFVRRGLLPSGGIIEKSYLWETWEDTPFTPRAGYPVEIELLWLTALKRFLPWVRHHSPTLGSRLEVTLSEGRESFQRFHLDGYLADSLSYQFEPRTELTPNGYIAFALDYPLPPALARSMVLLARQQLAGQVGILSLARRDWPHLLSPTFIADTKNFRRRAMASVGIYNYHRGIEWLWLNPFFVQGELAYGSANDAFWRYVNGEIHSARREAGVGGLSELHDARGALGADFQAWSMAGLIESLHAFSGVTVDALANQVRVCPQIPEAWPCLESMERVGNTTFQVRAQAKKGVQVVSLRPVGPAGKVRARLGARIPTGQVTVRLNGRDVGRDEIQIEPPAVPGAAGTAFITTALAEATAEFHVGP